MDLFCGAGGMSAGVRQAGFEVLAGADIHEPSLITYRRNFPQARIVHTDLRSLPPELFAAGLSLKPGALELVIGGPPCQGFSKNVPRSRRTAQSQNNRLVYVFLAYCKYLRPHAILMENVAAMHNAFDGCYTQEIVGRLEKWGYQVDHKVLNASAHGAPQHRKRTFFLASRVGSPALPQAAMSPPVTVWDAIGDLPSLEHGQGEDISAYASSPKNAYQQAMRNGLDGVTNHLARPLSPIQYERLSSLAPGQGHDDLPAHLRVGKAYSGAYGRLSKEMVAPTITRWCFHPGSGRYGHPVDIRTLTMREAARIQGFRDDFVFAGSLNQQAGQIGNAAPPLLVETIVRTLTESQREHARAA